MKEQRLWQIILTEEQLCVLMNAVEDWHRFICGKCSMSYATSFLSCEAMHHTCEILDKQVKPTMFPELYFNQSYSWNGGHPNPHMSKVAAISYMIYREIRHQLTLADNSSDWSVYKSETLTCKDSTPIICVKQVKNEIVSKPKTE